MRMIQRGFAAALIVAASVVAGTALSAANAATSEAVLAYEGRWVGKAILDCAGITTPLEITVEGGDMSGKAIVRGQGQGDGTYYISGYIDRKGRISEGRMAGPFGLSMRGNLSNREGKGQFHGPECSGSWKVALEEAAPPPEDKIVAAAPADDAPPVIEAPGEMRTEQPVIELTGRVIDASKIIEFTVDGAAAPLGADGRFQVKRGVTLGDSELVIAALDEWGNRSERRVGVTRRVRSEAASREVDAGQDPETDSTAPLIALPRSLETDQAAIDISGGVVDASRIVDLQIDGRSVALDADGTFSIRRGVPVGVSEFRVTALDEWGNEASRQVRVTRRGPVAAPADAPLAEESQTATRGQQSDDKQPPRINLPPKLVTEGPEIDIAGSVADDSAIVDLFVNERRFTLHSDGSFRIRQRLKIGINKFAFSATDEWGNKAVKRIDIERKRLDLALGAYHALVIGNNDYADMPKLKTAVADAEAVSRVLEERYGFSVTKLINATRYDVIGAMSDLRASLSFDTNLLIYYAGHGVIDPVTERGLLAAGGSGAQQSGELGVERRYHRHAEGDPGTPHFGNLR